MSTELFTQLFGLLDRILAMFPNYTERKIEIYHYHHKRYVEEMSKDIPYRDDARIDYHRDNMLLILQDFGNHIREKHNNRTIAP